jgi:hypothetical protein
MTDYKLPTTKAEVYDRNIGVQGLTTDIIIDTKELSADVSVNVSISMRGYPDKLSSRIDIE